MTLIGDRSGFPGNGYCARTDKNPCRATCIPYNFFLQAGLLWQTHAATQVRTKVLIMSDDPRSSRDAAPLRQRFLEGMSLVAATVTVITTDGPSGRAGTTATAMSSVSADTPKPTLLVCINELSSLTPVLLGNGTFCVNVLKDDQSLLADVFASRLKDKYADKFDCTEWKAGLFGQPVISGVLVAFECKLVSHNQVGTHHVCIGEVMDAVLGDDGNSLIYAGREYRTTVKPD